jgi:hypothetical protein
MAVVKAMGGSKARGSCNDRLDYITKEEKTEEKLIFTKDCSEDNFKKDFEDIKQIWDKTEGRQYFHMVQSFEKEDYITVEKAHEIGKKFIEDNPQMKDYQVVMATHKDKDHIHNHFIINSVGLDTGEKFQMYKDDLKQCKELSNEICREYGFKELDLERTRPLELDKAQERYSLSEKALLEKGINTTNNELRLILDNAREQSKTYQEFKENLKENGVEILRGEKEGAKSITFEYQEKKFRGNKLDDRYSSFDRINETLDQERTLKILKELDNSKENIEIKLEPISGLEELANKLREEELQKQLEQEKEKQESLEKDREEREYQRSRSYDFER